VTATRTTEPMIAARQAAAAAKERAVAEAIATLTRARQPVTISAVAARAGVSRSYLSRQPVLGPRIRRTPAGAPLRPVPAAEPSSVEAALRHHIRALQAAHDQQISHLRHRVNALEGENARLRGQLIATAT